MLRLRLRRPRRERQGRFGFAERWDRRERGIKRAIVVLTLTAAAALVAATPQGRYLVGAARGRGGLLVKWLIGFAPDHADREPELRAVRERALSSTRESLDRFYRDAPEPLRALFREAAMDPETGLVVSGRPDNGFVISSGVFEADGRGRSYRLRPNVRSVWLRQITLPGGPFGLFLVRDTPETRAAAAAAGGIVDEGSVQTTNSWGLRGPVPDPSASCLGLVLGDSFMQGMFVGDDDAPPLQLQRSMAELRGIPVSVLNTGHIGYAPEQYYRTLREYGPRFRPHFVVVSVCPNDFGSDAEVSFGGGGDWDEGAYWLSRIAEWCRRRRVACVVVPVPCDYQVNAFRYDYRYPAPLTRHRLGGSAVYCTVLDEFINVHLGMLRDADREHRMRRSLSTLYNVEIHDNHFSPAGSALWAKLVARRVDPLLPDRPQPHYDVGDEED